MQRSKQPVPKKKKGGAVRLLLILALLCAAFFLIRGKVLVVTEVRAVGNSLMSESEIAGISGIKLGDNLLKVDQEKIFRNFSSVVQVELENVEIIYPGTVVLHVREREPKAQVNCAGVILVIDSEGYILERRATMPEDELIVVNGMSVSLNSQGKIIESTKKGQIENMKAVLAAMDQQGLTNRISEIDVSDSYTLYLISKTGVQIILGDHDDLGKKMVWADTVLEKLTQDGVMSGVLDVSTGKNAAYAPR